MTNSVTRPLKASRVSSRVRRGIGGRAIAGQVTEAVIAAVIAAVIEETIAEVIGRSTKQSQAIAAIQLRVGPLQHAVSS